MLSISLPVSNKNKKQNTKYKQCHIILINLISIYLYIINILKKGFFFFFFFFFFWGVYVGETNKNFFLVITKITHWPLKNEQFSKSTLPPPFSLTETLSLTHSLCVLSLSLHKPKTKNPKLSPKIENVEAPHIPNLNSSPPNSHHLLLSRKPFESPSPRLARRPRPHILALRLLQLPPVSWIRRRCQSQLRWMEVNSFHFKLHLHFSQHTNMG